MSVEELGGLKKLFGIADSWRKEYENTAKNLDNAVKAARKTPGTMGAMLVGVLQAEAERQRSAAASLKRIATDLYQHERTIEAQIATGPPSSKQLLGELGKRGTKGVGHLAGAGLSALGSRLSAFETETRLPVVRGKTVQQGLGTPGHPRRVPPGDYFLDERLQELRHTMNPHIRVRLNEFEVSWFKQRAHSY